MDFNGVANKVILPDGKTAWLDPEGIARVRFGWDALRELAERLCIFVGKFAPLIRQVFGESTAVLLALDVALLACEVLTEVSDPLSKGVDIPDEAGVVQRALTSLGEIQSKYSGGV